MSTGEHVHQPPLRSVHQPPLRAAIAAPGITLSPRRLSAQAGWLGVVGLLIGGFLVSAAAAQSALLLPDTVKLAVPQVPQWLVGPLGHAGVGLGLGGLIVVFSGMFVCYLVALRAGRRLSTRTVVLSIVALVLLLALAPPLLSTDLFSYQAYARMGSVYGINPYVIGPGAIKGDPWYGYIGSPWVKTPTAYGPLFTILTYPVAALGFAASTAAFKLVAAACSLFVVFATWKSAKLRETNQLRAVILVGLNPVLLIYGIGGGHNDLLMLALLSGGIWALLAQRRGSTGALVIVAAAVKLTAGMLLPFAMLARAGAPGSAGRSGSRRFTVLGGAAIAAVIALGASFALFGSGPLQLLSTLQTIQSHGGAQSIPGFISRAVGLGRLSKGVQIGLEVVFVASFVWLVVRVRAGRLDWIAGAGWAVVALLVTSTFLLPWYVTWLLPLAALGRDRRLFLATMALSAICLTSL